MLKESGDYVIALDVCSLYPAAMKGTTYMDVRYPAGRHRSTDTEQFNPEIEFRSGKVGVYEIEYTPPSNIVYPVLPR
eukprot:36857-Eustigmatos_ZCMA.PRE.1